ncbi:type IX secretion system protein PorD [Bizionia sp. KMM 8389]
MHRVILFLFVLMSLTSYSQELNCNVVVNAQFTGNENLQVFKTLETQLKEFVNNTKWTNKEYGSQERVACGMFINITEYSSDVFKATIQVQSSRPVYGSSYNTPIYNINDKDFTFQYVEFQNLLYNQNQFESNLISVIAFHVYMILGLDADTFEPQGGDRFLKQAQTIVNYSQQENAKGWKLEDGLQTRFALIDNLMSPTFKEYRQVMYNYHRLGLDTMSADQKKSKELIAEAITGFDVMNRRRPNSFLLRTFFDAKGDEIEQIFSSGPNVEITELLSTLNRVAPMYSSKWRNIKF